MIRATILFADNDQDFLKTRSEFLEQEGYLVVPANNPTEAQWKLEAGGIDLAILDIRLVNDDDEKDTSGLTLAKEVARSVPKIILTGFPGYEYVREALKPQLDGLPVAVDFVAKQEGPVALLRSVEQMIKMRPLKLAVKSQVSIEDIRRRLAPVSLDVATQLRMDYEEVRREVVFTHRARLVLTIVGALVIIGGGISALKGQTMVGTLSATSGIVAELLVALFTSMAKEANKRMDQYHRELFRLLEMEQKRKSVK